ncbi:DHA2 family efflux MFS transporter permease subunit [Leekyejoonella antrihumi]|uniref:DHA2 family efflux MFS transporter permease subunit n=1 Tax=Leekyejoonella antrihumi TaxID=1660198 RepID=A0A563E028_9MICO|nr:DHA2 family efflux MFS transporter permease subunit [Leekyejoonella antrihumi]TWP35745.1 DHA2 family efflux MFS transporter permease subunit [Leekyejoonella antrihumi]
MSTVVEKAAGEKAARGSSHLGLALVVIACAQLMIVLDATIVNIALPHIQTDLGFSDSGRQWVVTAYALSLGSLLLLGGRLGDLVGRRRMFVLGVMIFALASLLGGIAPSPMLLIAARILQGAGAALASPAALALINTTFPAGKPRNRAMAVYAAMSGAGAAIGLILGGALTEADWRWTFFINVPIGLFAAMLAPRVLVESEGNDGTLDLPGAVTGTVGLFGLVYGLSHAAQQGASWGDFLTLVPLIGGVIVLGLFVIAESRAKHPLLPLRILTDRNRAVSLFTMLLVGAGMFALFFFLGLYIQQVLGYSPMKSGIAFLPFSAGMIASAGVASNLVSRVDPRWISGVGGILTTIALWGFTHLTVDSGYASHLLPWILVMSFGMGLLFIPLTLTATARIDKNDSGAAASALNTAQQIGGAVGIAALSTVFSHAATGKSRDLVAMVTRQAAAHGQAMPQTAAGKAAAMKQFQAQFGGQIQTYASTQAFWVAAAMVLVGAIATLLLLSVKHEELATDNASGAPVS